MPRTFLVLGPWQQLTDLNMAYAIELYERYVKHPDEVDQQTRAMFDAWGPPPSRTENTESPLQRQATVADNQPVAVIDAQRLVRNLREFGHLAACVNPLQEMPPTHPLVKPADGLTEGQLARIPARLVWPQAPAGVETALDAVRTLRQIYCGSIGYDFAHVYDGDEQEWLTMMAETGGLTAPLSEQRQRALLFRLIEVEEFEHFLHRTFTGQKRFSIEGLDVLVPMLDELIRDGAATGARQVMMGMAHRGRLNVLAHILHKPYEQIFSEFHAAPNKELVPSEGSIGINYGWTGDVKYHLGASSLVMEEDLRLVSLVLANNPSHLEFVNPVVEGFARAAQETRTEAGSPKQEVDGAFAILVHGDAAFPGEGVVAETLNLSRLPGYQTGGTIHIIANNQLGFTSQAYEGRSTRYASDLAKGFEIPIVHVNADDPAACLAAASMAHAYRQRYHKDFLIDLIGWRRWGHNEMDDPAATQPQMYQLIAKHESVRVQYAQRLVRSGVVSETDLQTYERAVQDKLRSAYDRLTQSDATETAEVLQDEPSARAATGITAQRLQALNDALLDFPDEVHVYSKLRRILERRRNAFSDGGKVDWAHAEALALASILEDGTPIRMSGQDSERGTFGQRHLVLHDEQTGETYCPLQHVPTARASFAIYNSPLSETAIMGYEYGYNVHAAETLVLWEAQFGDFANAGQVVTDQFLSSGLAKWGQPSGLVLLLPHGYEGQGPEHSSARLERFLQLSAESNWRVANVTTPAQYFHLLRSQALRLRDDPRPLVVMTPKSLLRNARAASDVADFEGVFEPVQADVWNVDPQAVVRLVLTTGKIGVDLAAAAEDRVPAQVAALRVEQLYPFPADEVLQQVKRYPSLREVIWLQEEPQNMGAWRYIEPQLRSLLPRAVDLTYIGRPERSSPSEGMASKHDRMQQEIIDIALTVSAAKAQRKGEVVHG